MHIMLDLETLDSAPTAAVLSIGAVKFDGLDTYDRFYGLLETDSQIRAGRTISRKTMEWWAEQSEEARAVFKESAAPTPLTLTNFADWVAKDNLAIEGVWGNGATFDNVVLATLYEAMGIRRPWSFRTDRCFRTIRALFDPFNKLEPERLGTHHNALHDAVHQARHLLEMSEKYGILQPR